MSLTGAKMSEEVWLTCLTHALSTEKEEIMGLLLGDIKYEGNGDATALIWGASPQPRSDRRKDRVETNPEQLAAASAQAERMSQTTGRPTRVIGWYHSHPHITVLPSHVDVRTQRMYQLLDSGFIGLIFSCFNEDALKVGRIQVIAFQSLDGKQKKFSRSQHSNTVSGPSVVDSESSWRTPDNPLSTSGSEKHEGIVQDASNLPTTERSAKGLSGSGSFFAHPEVNQLKGVTSKVDNDFLQRTIDVDPMDMTAGMQEAMHRSNLDMSGAEFVRKEVPLQVVPVSSFQQQVVPGSSFLHHDSPLTSFIDMQNMLFEEEKAAYNQAISQCKWRGKIHPLAVIHHTSTYHASLCKFMEYCLSPAIVSLQNQLKENETRLSLLEEEAAALENDFSNRRGGQSFSPSGHSTSYSTQRNPTAPDTPVTFGSPVGSTASRSRKSY